MTHALVCRGCNGLTRATLDVLPWGEAVVLVGAGGATLVSRQCLASPLYLTPPPPTDRAPHTEALRLSHVGTGRLLQAGGAQVSVVKIMHHTAGEDGASKQE